MPVGTRMLMAAAGVQAQEDFLPTSFELVSGGYLLETAGGAWYGRPQMLDRGDGVWVLIYRSGVDHGSDDANARFNIIFSDDEGATWTAGNTKLGGGAVSGAPFGFHSGDGSANVTDAILVRCPNDDLLVLNAERSIAGGEFTGTYQWRSTDGGESWTDEGAILTVNDLLGGGQAVVVGSTIYVAAWSTVAQSLNQPFYSRLWKSTDNGETWSHVSDMSDTDDDTNECSIAYLGGTTLLSILRTEDTRTLKAISTDMGATWGALTDLNSQLAIIHRPMLYTFADEPGRVYLTGRKYVLNNELTVLHYSDDGGATWSEYFTPEPSVAQDSSYTTFMKRSDNKYVLVTYRGTETAASLVQYVIEGVA